MVESIPVVIQCPNCSAKQPAEIVIEETRTVYKKECEGCKYVIYELEWVEVP